MLTEKVAKLFFSLTLSPFLPSVLIDIIFQFYFPAIDFFSFPSVDNGEEQEKLLNDICLLWITGKGFDRTDISVYQKSDIDLRSFDDFKSETVKNLIQKYQFNREENIFKFVTKNIEKYLDVPILHAPIVHLQYNEQVNSVYSDPKSSYLSSSRRERLAFNEKDDDYKKINKETRENFYQQNPHILRTVSRTHSSTISSSLSHPSYFTLKEILCACADLKPKKYGKPFKKSFQISGIDSEGYPVLTVFFDTGVENFHVFHD
jgi:hypothetical protein